MENETKTVEVTASENEMKRQDIKTCTDLIRDNLKLIKGEGQETLMLMIGLLGRLKSVNDESELAVKTRRDTLKADPTNVDVENNQYGGWTLKGYTKMLEIQEEISNQVVKLKLKKIDKKHIKNLPPEMYEAVFLLRKNVFELDD